MSNCASCHWLQPYAPGKRAEGGECMRNPPVVAVVRGNVTTLRPHVRGDDRCGEWKSDGKYYYAVRFEETNEYRD